jgi:hypothetical protein
LSDDSSLPAFNCVYHTLNIAEIKQLSIHKWLLLWRLCVYLCGVKNGSDVGELGEVVLGDFWWEINFCGERWAAR